MDEYDKYFAEVEEPKPKFRWPEVTDTHGNPIKRVGFISVQRVLNNPVSVTAESPWAGIRDYALVYCADIGVYIMRWGNKIRTAHFYLCSLDGHEACYAGVAGRDKAIKRFLKMLKKGRVYGPPDT